jgi:hypothetical protein
MSRIIIIEMPDKYEANSRQVIKHVQEKWPAAGLLRSADFSWWKYICSKQTLPEILPFCPTVSMIESVDKLIEEARNPKSYEERNP